jgi:hypothetical protein
MKKRWELVMGLRRILIFYFSVTVILASLDLITTEIGANQYGHTELNKYANTDSVWAMVLPQVVVLFVGLAVIVAGFFCNTNIVKEIRNGGVDSLNLVSLAYNNENCRDQDVPSCVNNGVPPVM